MQRLTDVVLAVAWKRVVVERYAQFFGRAGGAEFWWFFLANLIAAAILSYLGRVVSTVFLYPYLLYVVAVIVPGFAVSVRRLHDIGRSGWWILIGLVPVVGVIVLFVFHVMAGDPGINAYGPTPPPLPA